MNILMQFRMLPFLIAVAMLAFSVRLADVVVGFSHLSGSAYAQDDQPSHEGNTQDSTHENAGGVTDAAEGVQSEDQGNKKQLVFEDNGAEAPEWKDASDSDLDVTTVKMELFEDLVERRKLLENSEKDLQVREALFKAAEQELERKYQEMQKLRDEIEGLLEKQSTEEQERITSLVKIYEGMKPKDAARIFDTLDLDVLVQVVSRMSARKLSPVLAAMNPERARTITIMLAEQKKLPTLPEVN